jgi:trimeric autotransporter adhesin
VADLNGDGLPDLIVANGRNIGNPGEASGNTVSVLLNTTAPGATTASFAAPVPFTVGNAPSSVTVADVNGDGLPDLIVTNENDNTVSVLLNTTVPGPASGPGATTLSFVTQQTFTVGSAPSSVTAADLNGDGKPDLIVANYNDSTVSVLLNTTVPGPASGPGATTLSFATQQTFATGRDPIAVVAADLNGDGEPDLIAVNNFIAGSVSVLINTTAPGATPITFGPLALVATGSTPYAVTATDLNGDGKPDLIVANFKDNTVSVLLNTTVPGFDFPDFAPQQTFATGPEPSSVTAADVNGDGKPDLITANFNSGTISVLLNTTVPGPASGPLATTPSFAAQQAVDIGSNPFAVTVADLNGDGRPDIITANNLDATVSVLLNTTFAASVSGSPATGTIIYAVPTPSPTPSPTPTPTPSPTPTPKATPTPKPTPTPMRRPTPTPTPPCRGSDWNRCGSK